MTKEQATPVKKKEEGKMTVKDIVKQYLENNHYDGLCGEDCGCEKDDLMPCGEDMRHCVPGYRTKKTGYKFYITSDRVNE